MPRSGWTSARVTSKTAQTWSKSGLSIAETTGSTYSYMYLLFMYQVFTTTASSSSRGSPTTNASRRCTVCMHIVSAAATPYDSYVRLISTTNSMLQQRQHQQYDKQRAVLSVVCINNNNVLSLSAGTRYVSYSTHTAV